MKVTRINEKVNSLGPGGCGWTLELYGACWWLVHVWNQTISHQWTYYAIITSLWRQNDVATSFWRHNDVIIASCTRWGRLLIIISAVPRMKEVVKLYISISRSKSGIRHVTTLMQLPVWVWPNLPWEHRVDWWGPLQWSSSNMAYT